MTKYYYVKASKIWLVFRTAVIILLIAALVFQFPVDILYLCVLFLFIDIVLYWNKNNLGIDGYFKSVLSFWSAFFTRASIGNFVIGISDKSIVTRHAAYSISEISSFNIARGGSEPYLILKNGKRIDLEISWLNKNDRVEVERRIESILKTVH